MKVKAQDMHGCTVLDMDGHKIGDVTDVYVDAPTSEPEWLAVTTGIIGKKQVLVPVHDLKRHGDDLTTPYEKSMVINAPVVEGAEVNGETDAALFRHYHLRRELPGNPENREAWERNAGEAAEYRLRSWKAASTAA